MISISALNHIHKTGLFGNYESKNEENLIKVSEIKNILIVQIVQYKNSTVSFETSVFGNIFCNSFLEFGPAIAAPAHCSVVDTTFTLRYGQTICK